MSETASRQASKPFRCRPLQSGESWRLQRRGHPRAPRPRGSPRVAWSCPRDGQRRRRRSGRAGVGPWRGKGAAANVALELRRFLHPTRVIQPRGHLEEPPSERHEAIQAAADDPTKRLVRRRRPGGGRGWVQTATAPTWNRLVGDSRDTNSEPMPLSHFMGDLPSPERTVSGRRQGPIMGDQAIDRTPDPTQKSPNTSASEMAP